MVERVRAAGRASATASPLPTSEPERNSGVVTRAEPVAKAAAAVVAARPGVSRGTVVGFIGVAVAVAACLALYIKTSGSERSPTSAALQAEQAADAPGAAAAKLGQPVALAAKPNDGVLSPEALAVAPLPATAQAAKGAPPKAAIGAAPAAAAAAAAKPATGPSAGAKPEAVVLQDDPEPAKAPAVAEKKAEPEPPLKPAEGNSSGVPLNPSAGAVSTALSSVRGGAQACLAGQSEAVAAVVTFASDGHVQSVRASGPSGACIQAALSKAHIAPFAKDSFSATTTVRPP
jgi:hypothetical protein